MLTADSRGEARWSAVHAEAWQEAIATGIEPLEFRRKVEREMRFNLVVHDHDALFNIIDQQQTKL